MCSLGFFKEQYVLYSARTTSNVPTKTIQTKNFAAHPFHSNFCCFTMQSTNLILFNEIGEAWNIERSEKVKLSKDSLQAKMLAVLQQTNGPI